MRTPQSILHVQYTSGGTKGEDPDLSKHNGSEPLVAVTVIRRKEQRLSAEDSVGIDQRLDVSNLRRTCVLVLVRR